MRLCIGSEAHGGAGSAEGLIELLGLAAAQGLAGVELGEAAARVLADDPGGTAAFRAAAEREGVSVVGLVASEDDGSRALAELAGVLGAPLLRPEVGEADAAHPVLPLLRTDPAKAADLALAAPAGVAWEIDPAHDAPDAVAEQLRALGPRLAYIRFRGGGPETATQTGQGVGSLMAQLALARFAGPLVLLPSTPAYRRAWSAWLGRRGRSGCGSKQSDPSLVELPRLERAHSLEV